MLIFVVSAVFAALMGTASAHYSGFITPDMAGFFHSIEFVTMVVLGGMASTYGALVGAVILTVLPQLLTGFDDLEMAVFGFILMAVMIFMPRGLVPTLTAKLAEERIERADERRAPDQALRRRGRHLGAVLRDPAGAHPLGDRPQRRR
ncbi:MAG: branched-chain amino acid ABC transporter permease [Arhodomonas sp.]|nr:branched-chain amino acid ABC transporter permease [Arhodomonas sp.]